MPLASKVVFLAVAIAIAAVCGLLGNLAGRRLGPDWKRRLERAGIVLGAAVGFGVGLWLVLELERPSWKPFRSPDGSFSVSFPGDPEETESSRDSPVGRVAGRKLACSPRFSRNVYEVFFVDYPGSIRFDAAAAYEQYRAQLVERSKGVLLKDVPIEQEKTAGRYVVIQVSHRRFFLRMFFVEHRLYVVSVQADDSEDTRTAVVPFLNSFALSR